MKREDYKKYTCLCLPREIKRVIVNCSRDKMSLYINDELVAQVYLPEEDFYISIKGN